jgi:tetratricopeptide (TPR) repeat protein
VGHRSVFAQSGIDSAAIKKRIANEYVRRDSMLAAAKQRLYLDSLAREQQKMQQKHFRDSLATARQAQRTADSLKRVEDKLKLLREQRTRDSLLQAKLKRQQDSVVQAKRTRDSLLQAQLQLRENQAKAAQRARDSLTAARLKKADEAKKLREAAQKRRDDLARYKNSKRYKDSVAAVKQRKTDSIGLVRQNQRNALMQERNRVNDSIRTVRQITNDSITESRKRYNDSVRTALQTQNEKLKAERDRIRDSLLTIRKHRADSLALVRKKNPTPSNAGKSLEDQQRAAAMALHKKKQAEWTNEKFLTKKWSMPRRIFQNTVTHYNYYYNARRKYVEALKLMSKSYKEDFDKPISLLPYNVEKQGSTVTAAMDTVIKKSSFGTQIHDPRSKWFDNMYYLMGKASYTKGDIDGALMAFQFVANEYRDQGKKGNKKPAPQSPPVVKREKGDTTSSSTKKEAVLSIATPENRKGMKRLKHQPVRNEALVWLAQTYVRAEQYGEAQALLNVLEKDNVFPKRMKPALFAAQIQLAMSKNDDDETILALRKRLKTKLKEQERFRSEFLLAQLYARQSNYTASSEHYKKSLSKQMDPEMAFFAKLNLARQSALSGTDKQYALQQLQQIIADPKYAKYKSQALNTLAALEAEATPDKALATLKKSIDNPENKNNLQKALAYKLSGDIHYRRAYYPEAKTAYDSAVFYGSNPAMDSLAVVTGRKNVLSDVVANLKVIRTQDSLLALAGKSDKEQRAVAKKELERMKKEKADMAAPAVAGVALQPNATPGAAKSNWYFYNTATMEKGIAEFKQKWGNRPLQDNWRRKAALSMANNGSGGGIEKDSAGQEVDVLSLNLLLSKLPKTPAEQQLANKKIIDAWYDLGLAYYSRLENYPAAILAFDTLLKRYPNTVYKAPSYYGLFLSYGQLSKPDSARAFAARLNSEFAGTEYALRAINPNIAEEQAAADRQEQYRYDSLYQLMQNQQFEESKTGSVRLRQTLVKNHPLVVKCTMLEAASMAGLKQYGAARTVLDMIIKNYPGSPEQEWAQALYNRLEGLKTDTLLEANGNIPDSTVAGVPFSVNQGNSAEQDSLAASAIFKELRDAEGKGIYIADPDAEHKLLIFVKMVDGRTMGLKSAMSDYNLMKHNTKDYTTNMNMFTAKQAVLSVDRFSNAVFARQYKQELEKEKVIFSQFKANEFQLLIISKANFSELIKTRDILGYIKFYKKNYP